MTNTLLATSALYLAILAFKVAAALIVIRRSRPRANVSSAVFDESSVTIAQPILSGDPDLHAALRDNLRALPNVQFTWLIDEEDASARTIANDAQRIVPDARVQIVLCAAAPDSVNPKAFKLEIALASSSSEIFVVLDDDARLSAAALRALCDGLAEGDLATALPYYVASPSVGGRLLAQFVNNNAALTYLPLLPFSEPISINGMCYAARTAFLRSIGGFAPVLRHLADDLAVARAVQSHGGVIVQTTSPVEICTGVPTLQRYWQQMHRWFLFATILLRAQTSRMRIAIAALQGLHPVLLWLLTAATLASPSTRNVVALLLVLCIRAAAIIVIQRATTGRPRHDPLMSIVSELLQPMHLAHAMLVRTITWRTRRYRVRDNDDFSTVSALNQ
jgi:ceramide glucosyltransferase